MLQSWRTTAILLALSTLVVLACTATQAGAQPPVARPQPPPTTPSAGAPTVPPAATTTTPRATPDASAPTPSPAAPAATNPPSTTAAAAPAKSEVSTTPTGEQAPVEATLGVPVMANAVFIGSYDAGKAGQRYYLYGTQTRFADVVLYYRTVLKQKGELVYDIPATHMFEVGKYREEDVAFPPGVTIKDYAVGGSAGLANPMPGAVPSAFPTVIQIVPPGAPPAARPRH